MTRLHGEAKGGPERGLQGIFTALSPTSSPLHSARTQQREHLKRDTANNDAVTLLADQYPVAMLPAYSTYKLEGEEGGVRAES